MKIAIHTDNINTFRAIENEIGRLINATEMNKYIYFKSKEDFIEHLYRLAVYTQPCNTDLDYNPLNDWTKSCKDLNYVSITTWVLQCRKKKYNQTFELDSEWFTYP